MKTKKNKINLSKNVVEDIIEPFNALVKAMDCTACRCYGPPKPETEFDGKFYEWSNHESQPLKFGTMEDLVDFLETKCKHKLSTDEKVQIYGKGTTTTTGVHIMFSSDGEKLFIENGTYGLKWEHERYNNQKKISTIQTSSTQPSSSTTPPQYPCQVNRSELPYHGIRCGHDPYYYDDYEDYE